MKSPHYGVKQWDNTREDNRRLCTLLTTSMGTWRNQLYMFKPLKASFLITDVSWGCFVLVLVALLRMCWDQVTHQKHLAWTHLSLRVSSTQQHTGGWRGHRHCRISLWCPNWCCGLSIPYQFSECCWCFTIILVKWKMVDSGWNISFSKPKGLMV